MKRTTCWFCGDLLTEGEDEAHNLCKRIDFDHKVDAVIYKLELFLGVDKAVLKAALERMLK